jgi:hypothetical protein
MIDWQQVVAIVLIPATPLLIVQAINIVWSGLFQQPKPSLTVIRWLVYAASIGITLLQTSIALPPISEPAPFVLALLTLAGAVHTAAQMLYDKFLQPVLEGLDRIVFAGRALGLLAPKRHK